MPWQVPITVDGLEYPVTFNTETEPTQQDYDEAIQQILQQRGQTAPQQPTGETPGYFSQLGTALGLGYRQMASGVGATFNALTGDTADVAAEMVEMGKLQREQQAAQTPEDVEFMRRLEEAKKAGEEAQGPIEYIGALAQYPAAVLAEPGAAFKTAVQSAPNVLISAGTQLAGRALGGLVGGAGGLELGPGAILTGIAGSIAGGALSNTLMEAGPSIYDVLNERTQGAAANMTADQIATYLKDNPDIIDEGLKTGAIRGTVIGAVESLGMKGSGKLMTMPERAAARAVQKKLVDAGVDIASKEAVDKALLDPALRTATRTAAEAAKKQFSSAGNLARLAGGSAIETGAAVGGELAAQAAAGQEIDTTEAFLEGLGEMALSVPISAANKTIEGAKYMLNPALQNPDTQLSAQAAQEEINKAKAEAARLAAEKAAEAARIAEEQRKAAEKAPTPTPISIADSPSPNLLPRATENVEPKPIRNAGESREDFITREDAWEEQYGDMRKGGRTHNDDGTPYQPTVRDEVANKAFNALKEKSFDDRIDAIGFDIGAELSTSIEQLLNDGWIWDDATNRMVDPQNRGETPLQALMRIRGVSQPVAGSATITPAPAPKQSAAEKALGLPPGTLAPSATPPSPQTGQVTAPTVGKQTLTTPTQDATSKGNIQENIREEPQDRVEGRKAEEASLGDSLLRPAEGEVKEEVITPQVKRIKIGGTSPKAQSAAQDIRSLVGEETELRGQVITAQGVKVKLLPFGESVRVSEIEVPSDLRGQGLASRVLEQITSEADRLNVSLTLSAEPFGQKGLSKEKLESWYASKGFVPSGKQGILVRKPQQLPSLTTRADPFAAAPLVDNLPALIAVRDNNATPEQVQSLVDQGLVEQVDGQNIITEAGVAAMPEDQRPKLTPAERAAEVEGMGVPVAEPSVTTPAKAATVKSTELRVGDEVSFKGNTYRVKKILSDGRVRAEFTNPEGIARIPKGSENITTLPRNVNFTRIEKPSPAPLREGAGVTGVAQPEPPRGSILEVGEVSTKTETLSTPQSLDQNKEDAKQQKKDSDENLKALNSLEAGTKTNPVFGTVTREDANQAMRLIEDGKELPNVFFTVVTTREEFLADPRNEQLYPQVWNALKTNKKIEGLFDDATNTPFVFTDGVVVYDLDRKAAKELGISPQVAAVRRVLRHENIHKGMLHLTPSEMVAMRRFLATIFSEEALDNLAKIYTKYANWRSDPRLYFQAIEEIVNQKLDQSTVLPKDGIWGQFFELLTAIWRRITGKRNQPTVKDMKDVMRLVRNGLIRSAKAQADQTRDGGNVMLSYVGEKAIENLPEERRQFMRDSLDAAKAMAAAGKSSEEIRAATGWFPGLDGKMRWEVPDNDASFIDAKAFREASTKVYGGPAFSHLPWKEVVDRLESGQYLKISDVLNHPLLFEAYPDAANIAFFPISGNIVQGSHRAVNGNSIITATVTLDGDQISDESLSTILHELQHYIQNNEGFAKGGSPDNLLTKADLLDAVKFRQSYQAINKYRQQIAALVDEVRKEKEKTGFLGFGGPNKKAVQSLNDRIEEIQKTVNEIWAAQKKNLSLDKGSVRAALLSAINRVEDRFGTSWFLNKRNEGLDMVYRSLAGEIEARDVQARQSMTDEQRAATAPYSSENIAPEDAIVMFGSGGAQMSMAAPATDAEYLAAVEAGDMETAQRMVDEAAKAAGAVDPIIATIAATSDNDTGAYHYGDAGIGRDTVLKNMGYGRSTGHFGTGTYFLGKKDSGARIGRSLKYLDLSGLNMAKPTVPQTLHDALRVVNKIVLGGEKPEFSEPRFDGRRAQSSLWVGLNTDRSEEQIKNAILKTYSLFDSGKNDGVRSPSTYVMQFLGYDGIDVRGTTSDNTDQGSVVYPPLTDGYWHHGKDPSKLTSIDLTRSGQQTNEGSGAFWVSSNPETAETYQSFRRSDLPYDKQVSPQNIVSELESSGEASNVGKNYIFRTYDTGIIARKINGSVEERSWAIVSEDLSDLNRKISTWLEGNGFISVSSDNTKLKLFLFYKNPMKADGGGKLKLEPWKNLTLLAKEEGKDAIVVTNTVDTRGTLSREQGQKFNGTSVGVFNPNQIKSADPVTYDDAGNVIPLSQRFQPTSPDIRLSLPIVHSSESEASYANGQMAASMVTFTPRQMYVYSALEGAYNMSRKPGRHSVPLSELYQAALEALPDMTQQEFSEAVQTMYQNNSALLNAGESDFSVVNKDGDRVSSVVFLGKGPMASMIPSSEVPEIANKLASDLKASVTEGEQTPYEGLSFTGVTPKTHARVDYRGVRKSAEDFVNQMIRAQRAKGKSYADALIEVANTITNPSFANEYMADSGTEEKLLATQAIAGPLNSKIYSALLTTKDDVTRIKLNDAYTNVSTYYEGSGTIGGTVMGYRAWESTNGKYGWMLDSWKADALKNAEDAINSQMGGSVSIQIGESLRRSVEGVSDSTANEVEKQAQEDRDAALFREGQEALSGEDKNTFESIKSFLKIIAIINRRKLIRAGNQAMASIVSDEEYNAIMAMSDEEANALEKEITAKLSAALKKLNSSLSGREEVKAKVDAAINVATDRANKGEDITFTQVTIEEAMADLFKPGFDTREKIVDNVADALLKRAKQAMAKPSKISSIQQLIASIKRTLLANIKVDKTTDADSLGRMLAMTFAQQVSEARVYASSWSEGRKKVREMLAEIGIEESELDSELNKIMPPTPTLAFSPSAAKRAIALAMEESGVSREDLLDPRPEISKQAKNKLMAHLDKAAANENLTEQGWNKTGNTGRQLAEKAIDEAIAKWRIEQQNRLEISNLVAEQADNPVSIEDFAKKLSKFNLTPKQVKKYFDIAARAAVRSVEMRKDQARRIIYTRGDIRPDVLEKEVDGDTVIDAFTDQVSSPTDLKTFVERLDKLGVTFDLAESLFNTAARERRDRQRTRVFDMIEGPRALQKMLDEIRNVRAGLEVPLRSPIPWKELLSKPAKSVAEYRQKVLDAIMANPDLASVDSEVKQRLADMFADVWQQQLDNVVNRIIDNYTQQLDRAKRRHAGDVLNKTRLQVIQHLNLNALSNDAFTRILGEKFGIKMELTEAERENIQRLVDILQDETLPKNKRNQAANDLALALVNDTKVGWSERLSAFWTSSVLAGWNTMIAIGLAFLNGANIIMVNLPMKIMSNLINGDFKGAFYSTFDSLNDIKRYIEAFPEALERSWHYLNTGRVEFLESEASAPDRIFRGWADVLRYRKVAEAMANDPKKVTQWMGKFSVMISRMMTALDGFNTILTKRGTLSMAVRLTAKSPEDHQRILEKASLEHYRQQILASDPYFAQMNSEKRALLNATAEAMMYEAMNKEGAKLENADFFASESAMTMNPTGIGGIVYNKIRSADVEVQEFMRRKLAEQKLKAAVAGPMSLENAKLAGMFVAHFIAYNAINMIGLRFARFASNKFNQGLSFIPVVGILRGWEASNNQLADRKEAFYDMIKRNQMVGMFFVGAGSILLRAIADEPDDEERGFFINGGLKNVPTDKRRQLQESGKLEYRLGAKIGGKWYIWNYQNSPYSQLFAAVGAISDIIRFSPDKWNDKSKLDVALSVAASGLSSTLDLPALQGLGTLMGRSVSSSDPTEQFWENIGATTANWVGGFIPKPFMDVDYILDDNRRKYTTIWEKFAGKVPFYRRYVGEDYYNILGDPIKANTLPGSREFLVGKTEPVYQILGALNSRNIWLTPANAEYRMVGKGRNRRRLTQEEADAYSFETGKGYKAMILRYGPRALQMDPERAKAFLHDKADQIRDRALNKVYRGYRSRTATP